MVWRTTYNRVWIVKDNEKIVCHTCGAYNADIQPDSISIWICGYCGKTIENNANCPHCNAPRKARFRTGTIDLVSMLPEGDILDSLKDEFEIHIMHGDCSDPRIYVNDDVIILIKNCKVQHKFIPEIVARRSEESCIIELHLTISGDISLRFKKNER